ncbi:MAG: Maf family protein [Aestuariivita sp.]|nr:Maf family protein [Aestuariivita sp.]MCY4347407.1 Maf family protein [Aestuariivita sp.]
MSRLILGSASPRRKDLLAQVGIVPDAVSPPNIDETKLDNELPRNYCLRIAQVKAGAITATDDDIVLCADTIVSLGRRVMGKPRDAAEARAMLQKISGRRHRVLTAVVVRRGSRQWSRIVTSYVRMKRLSQTELNAYLATEDWFGKAGAYGIQGPAGAFVSWMSGSFSAIVGLPLTETVILLQTAGYKVWRT